MGGDITRTTSACGGKKVYFNEGRRRRGWRGWGVEVNYHLATDWSRRGFQPSWSEGKSRRRAHVVCGQRLL